MLSFRKSLVSINWAKAIGLFFIALSTAQAQSDSLENSTLWEISGNGLAKSSYLFGTIHSIAEKDFVLTHTLQAKLSETQTLATEIDLNISIFKQIKIIPRLMLPSSKTMADYMSEADYQLLETYIVDSLKIKPSKFNTYRKFKPLFMSAMIEEELAGKTKSYDMEITKLARKQKKKAVGLETLEYQLDIFDKISVQDQIKMMMDDIKSGKRDLDGTDTITELYKTQDISRIYTLTQESGKEIPEFMEILLFTRNRNWIPVIEKLIKENSTFVAVGAGHLAGEQGVIKLLHKAGYTVTAIVEHRAESMAHSK